VNPYLSVVVATRNDDHGGDPLKRLQALVHTLAAQCRLTGLSTELIVVEWNPPPDRPRVSELLRVPADLPFPVRFVEVPHALHSRLLHSGVLPLFQMIAKNVGIRRARGEYVLATNIDIIFSTPLVESLAARTLQPFRLYRVDRHDIQSDVPIDASLETMMEFCRSHQLRVHFRSGTQACDRLGTPVVTGVDIADGQSIRLGSGWHMREDGDCGGSVRWANAEAELIVDTSDMADDASLELDVESNPYAAAETSVTIAIGEADTTLRQVTVSGRALVDVSLPAATGNRLRRIRLRASTASIDQRARVPLFDIRRGLYYRLRGARLRRASVDGRPLFEYPLDGWTAAYESIHISAAPTADGLAVSTDLARRSYTVNYGPLRSPRRGRYRFLLRARVVDGGLTAGVLSRDRSRWIHAGVQQSQAGDICQFDITVELPGNELFWLMISNDHPDGYGASRFVILELRGSEDLAALAPTSEAETESERAAIARVARESASQSPSRRLSEIGDSVITWISRRLSPRVRFRLVRAAPEYVAMQQAVAQMADTVRELEPLRSMAGLHRFLFDQRPDDIHVNACGDFQLMAREHWHALRGYPEFQTFSMNLDGLMSYIATAAGIGEHVFDAPIYHLEHEVGSGWSPEGEGALNRRIAERGITWVDWPTVFIWAAYMRWLRSPIVFNQSSWGFGDEALPERVLGPALERSPA
jgi:hypothetical protein